MDDESQNSNNLYQENRILSLQNSQMAAKILKLEQLKTMYLQIQKKIQIITTKYQLAMQSVDSYKLEIQSLSAQNSHLQDKINFYQNKQKLNLHSQSKNYQRQKELLLRIRQLQQQNTILQDKIRSFVLIDTKGSNHLIASEQFRMQIFEMKKKIIEMQQKRQQMQLQLMLGRKNKDYLNMGVQCDFLTKIVRKIESTHALELSEFARKINRVQLQKQQLLKNLTQCKLKWNK